MSIQFPNLGINLDYVGKSIRIFGFEITFFGLLIAAGMLLGLGFIVLEARRCGEKEDDYLEMMILSLVTGVIGARALYVCFSWNLYKGNVNQIFNLRGGGLAFYGGLFGGMLGAAIYCAIRKKAFMQMADTACMGLVIAQIIGRWGDFFNRESFGEYTNSIFAMQLPLSAVRSSEVTSVMRENLETIGGVSYIQVHPVFLYESLWCLLLFHACVEKKETFSWRGILKISGRIRTWQIHSGISENRQADDSRNFHRNLPGDLSGTVSHMCGSGNCGELYGEEESCKAQTQERTGL